MKTTIQPYIENGLSDDEKMKIIENSFARIMKALGLDLDDDSLKKTPYRIAKMYVKELFWGLKPENFPRIMTIENKMNVNEMITVNNIRAISVCEHHFATIDGYVAVAYVPRKKIIGLSKINRIVKYYCRRPQVQERLTKQVADALVDVLKTPDVAVTMKARHYCIISRGAEDQSSETVTTDLRGIFRSGPARSEFLRAAK